MSARALLVAAALAGLLGAPAARAAAPAGVTLTIAHDSLAVGSPQLFAITVSIAVAGEYGFTVDRVEASVRVPGLPDEPAASIPVPGDASSISAGARAQFAYQLSRARHDGTLVVMLSGRVHGQPVAVRDSLPMAGYDRDALASTTTVKAGKGTVSLTRVPAAAGHATGAGLLLLCDEQSKGGADVGAALALSQQGYTVVLVYPPGCQGTPGPPDLAGPAAKAGALAGLQVLASMPGVDAKRIAVWGAGTGGTVALLVAEERPEVRAVVAMGAITDLRAAWGVSNRARQDHYEAEAGTDSAAWKSRSPSVGIAKLRCPVYLMQGEKDAASPAEPVKAFAAELAARKVDVRTRFGPIVPREFATLIGYQPVLRFLAETTAARP